MSARHSNGTVKTSPGFIVLLAGGLSAGTGLALGVGALVELFRYSPYENPGALDIGLWTGLAAVLLAGIPAGLVLLLGLRSALRRYRAWKRTLTPGQRTLLAFAEVAAMEAAHIAWRDHNRNESARLTASVMGEKREQ
jgi:hypothetical protein